MTHVDDTFGAPARDDPRLRRLGWRCRRGMLELDMLLQRYLAGAGPGLAEADLVALEALLDCSDQELWQWLLGAATPPTGGLGDVVARIRRAIDG
jgi:antitoxin CptB